MCLLLVYLSKFRLIFIPGREMSTIEVNLQVLSLVKTRTNFQCCFNGSRMSQRLTCAFLVFLVTSKTTQRFDLSIASFHK